MCPQNLIFLLCVMVATFLWQTKYLYLVPDLQILVSDVSVCKFKQNKTR